MWRNSVPAFSYCNGMAWNRSHVIVYVHWLLLLVWGRRKCVRFRKRAEYCFRGENSLNSAANSVSCARNSVSSLWYTNNRLNRTPELSEGQKLTELGVWNRTIQNPIRPVSEDFEPWQLKAPGLRPTTKQLKEARKGNGSPHKGNPWPCRGTGPPGKGNWRLSLGGLARIS